VHWQKPHLLAAILKLEISTGVLFSHNVLFRECSNPLKQEFAENLKIFRPFLKEFLEKLRNV
jgi:hypothetical protein